MIKLTFQNIIHNRVQFHFKITKYHRPVYSDLKNICKIILIYTLNVSAASQISCWISCLTFRNFFINMHRQNKHNTKFVNFLRPKLFIGTVCVLIILFKICCNANLLQCNIEALCRNMFDMRRDLHSLLS